MDTTTPTPPAPAVKVGQVYLLKIDADNPFNRMLARVDEIRGDWVRYSTRIKFSDFTGEHTSRISEFLVSYTLASAESLAKGEP